MLLPFTLVCELELAIVRLHSVSSIRMEQSSEVYITCVTHRQSLNQVAL